MATPEKTSKRRHVLTEKMQAFVRAQSDASPVRLLHCPHEGCGKVLTSSPGLRYHLKAHLQDRPFLCDKCRKTFKSANGLKYHQSKTKCVGDDWPNYPAHNQQSSSDEAEDDDELAEDVDNAGGVTIDDNLSDEEKLQKQIQSTIVGNDNSTIVEDADSISSNPRLLKRSKSLDDTLENPNTASSGQSNLAAFRHRLAIVTGAKRSLTPPVETEETEFKKQKLMQAFQQLPSTSASTNQTSCSSSATVICSSGVMSPKSMSKLEELAIFATSSQSPLLRRTPPVSSHSHPQPVRTEVVIKTDTDEEEIITSIDPQPGTSSADSDVGSGDDLPSTSVTSKFEPIESDSRVTSSSPYPASPQTMTGQTWTHPWPDAVWQCFMKGSKARFISGKNTEWQLVEDIAEAEELARKACLDQSGIQKKCYAPNGLKLLHIEEVTHKEENRSILRLRFVSSVFGQPEVLVECVPNHPFFVKNKGWSSFHPSLTVKQYGIPCNELESGDLCLPPSHPDATYSKDIVDCLQSYKFTPMDSSAVFTLSNMAKQRRDQTTLLPCPKSARKNLAKTADFKQKRPMNAFMLFAKKFRLQYTQAYPGKDNRAISILLGEQWKRLAPTQRAVFTRQAKKLAEQTQKNNPDCYKYKSC